MSDVVGASTSPVSGVKAQRNHLIVTLTKASPDFLAPHRDAILLCDFPRTPAA